EAERVTAIGRLGSALSLVSFGSALSFCVLLRRPPTAPLFPYTTLFRSVSAEWITAGEYQVEIASERIPARVSLQPFFDPAGERVDRKSTRLNSSHRTISYAVFCLKKKKKKTIDVRRSAGAAFYRTATVC